MSLSKYGVLKGTVIGHLRDADDDHYQILVKAGSTLSRVAVNVRSAAANAPSTVLFTSLTTLPKTYTTKLQALPLGYSKLASQPNGVALDFLRSKLFKPTSMKPLPPDVPGKDNDLKDLLESAVLKAMRPAGALIYALGERWGPEVGKPDQYFSFSPGNGIHDIHMNQGNHGKYKKDNGIFQDGALILSYPNADWLAVFLAFQSQSFMTDDHGNPV
jgi:uncharacterized protein YukJ